MEVRLWKSRKRPARPASIFAGTIPAGAETSLSLWQWGIVSILTFGISGAILQPVSGMPKGECRMRGNSSPFTG